jgi:fluoroquinolone transport system permease protein
MNRQARTFVHDIVIQARNRLYAIGVAVAVIVAFLFSFVLGAEEIGESMPTVLLLTIGGSTLMYVGGMILFEKSEGTLGAVVVTPLRNGEYLVSKVASLSLLATVEATVLVAFTLLFVGGWSTALPRVGVFVAGVVAMGVIYTLIGIIIVVRYGSVTEFLVPLLFIAVALQAPAIHFSGLWEHPLLLLIPTAPPTLILQGAWEPLARGEWLFAGAYTLLVTGALGWWSRNAFYRHVIERVL